MKRSILRAVPYVYGLMVSISLYIVGGGRYPLLLDLWVVGLAGLVTYTGLRQLIDQALTAAEDRKDDIR